MLTKKLVKTVHREASRVVALVLIGLVFIAASPSIAMGLGIPALSPWGLFFGGAFIVAAISHIMRRALFPDLDLQLIAAAAVKDQNLPAAIVFLAICIVLATFLFLNGSMLRM